VFLYQTFREKEAKRGKKVGTFPGEIVKGALHIEKGFCSFLSPTPPLPIPPLYLSFTTFLSSYRSERPAAATAAHKEDMKKSMLQKDVRRKREKQLREKSKTNDRDLFRKLIYRLLRLFSLSLSLIYRVLRLSFLKP